MDLPFFFEPELLAASSSFTLSEESSKHAIQVLRMKEGEPLKVTNGKGLSASATIIDDHKKHAVIRIGDIHQQERSSKHIRIAISPTKNNGRFEWFLEKATEIGVTEVIPLICERTERAHFKWERMNGILVSAMLQSQQTWLPLLHQPTNCKELVRTTTSAHKLVAHCMEGEKRSVQHFMGTNDALILIGPEGDLTPTEVNAAIENGFTAVTLGTTRLRTETAGIVAATLLSVD